MEKCYLSLVVAVYYEEECIEEFIRQATLELGKIGKSFEIVFVDDGSTDRTVELIRAKALRNPSIKLVELSYNHGKPLAVTAGLAHTTGEYVIMMDPDLQDPPDAIPKFLEEISKGYNVVYGIRAEKNDTIMRKILSGIFWWVLDKFTGITLPRGLSAMRIMNRNFVDQFNKYGEVNRFIEGIFSHVGLQQSTLVIENRKRFAGVSKFNFKRRMQLAFTAILDYSDIPLRFTVRVGALITAFGFLAGLLLIIARLFVWEFQVGWPSLVVIIVTGFGLQILFMGILATYLGRIYNEVKGRPLYSVKRRLNL